MEAENPGTGDTRGSGSAGSRAARPTLADLYVLAPLLLITARLLFTRIAPNDYWFHLALGRWIVAEAAIPTHDFFTYTEAGSPYADQAWLAQVILYGLHRAGGLPLVIVVHAALLAVTYGLLLRLCYRISRSPRVAGVAVMLVGLPLTINWAVRPQSLVYPLFMAALVRLWSAEERWSAAGGPRQAVRLLWPLPLFMVAWVNIHGSFVLMFLLIGAFGLGSVLVQRTAAADRPPLVVWAAAGVVTLATSLVNPLGPGIYRAIAELAASPGVQGYVTEWQPPRINQPVDAIFFLAVPVLIAFVAARRPRGSVVLLTLLGGMAVGGYLATRGVVWFGFVAAVSCAALLRDRLTQGTPGSTAANRVLLLFMAALVVVAMPWVRQGRLPDPFGQLVTDDTPIAATDHLRQLHPQPRRILNDVAIGSYLTWAVPDLPVFIDTRFELFSEQQLQDFLVLQLGYDVERLVNDYRFDAAMLHPVKHSMLIAALEKDVGWRLEYEDGSAVILVPPAPGG